MTQPPWLHQSRFGQRTFHPPTLGWQTTPTSISFQAVFQNHPSFLGFFFWTHLQTYQPPFVPPFLPLETLFHILWSQLYIAITSRLIAQDSIMSTPSPHVRSSITSTPTQIGKTLAHPCSSSLRFNFFFLLLNHKKQRWANVHHLLLLLLIQLQKIMTSMHNKQKMMMNICLLSSCSSSSCLIVEDDNKQKLVIILFFFLLLNWKIWRQAFTRRHFFFLLIAQLQKMMTSFCSSLFCSSSYCSTAKNDDKLAHYHLLMLQVTLPCCNN